MPRGHSPKFVSSVGGGQLGGQRVGHGGAVPPVEPPMSCSSHGALESDMISCCRLVWFGLFANMSSFIEIQILKTYNSVNMLQVSIVQKCHL